MSRATRTASMQTRGTPKKRSRNKSRAIIGAAGSLQPADEVGDRLPDGVAGIFLDEMQPGHGDLGLVRPRATDLPLLADQDGARLGVDEELRGRVLAAQ